MVLRRLARSPAFLHLTFGSGFVGLVGFGTNLFLIPLLVRRFDLPLAHAGLVFALSFSLATMVGQVSGGYLIARLIRRDIRWGGWAPATAVGLALPFYLLAIHQSDWRWLVAFLFVATTLLYAFTPAIMTITQSLVEPRMRASPRRFMLSARPSPGWGWDRWCWAISAIASLSFSIRAIMPPTAWSRPRHRCQPPVSRHRQAACN